MMAVLCSLFPPHQRVDGPGLNPGLFFGKEIQSARPLAPVRQPFTLVRTPREREGTP